MAAPLPWRRLECVGARDLAGYLRRVGRDGGPGIPAQALSGTFDNDGPTTVYVSEVDAAVTQVSLAADAVGDCTPNDYALDGFPVPVGQEITSGDGVGTWAGGTIAFDESDDNQDGCKGATVTTTYTVS